MQGLDWNVCLPLSFGTPEAPALSLHRALAQEPLREGFEAFIQQRFRKAHNAEIRQFMPELFGLNDGAGRFLAPGDDDAGKAEGEEAAGRFPAIVGG